MQVTVYLQIQMTKSSRTPRWDSPPTIKGPVRPPNGTAFDSAGDVFVTGEVDSTFNPAIFKYDASGTFIKSFGTPALSHPGDWRHIHITSADRLFVCGTQEGTIAEFTTAGATVRTLAWECRENRWALLLAMMATACSRSILPTVREPTISTTTI